MSFDYYPTVLELLVALSVLVCCNKVEALQPFVSIVRFELKKRLESCEDDVCVKRALEKLDEATLAELEKPSVEEHFTLFQLQQSIWCWIEPGDYYNMKDWICLNRSRTLLLLAAEKELEGRTKEERTEYLSQYDEYVLRQIFYSIEEEQRVAFLDCAPEKFCQSS